MLFFELFIDFFLDIFLDIVPGHEVCDPLSQKLHDGRQFRFPRRRPEKRIFIEDPLQRQHTIPAVRRAHERQRLHLARLYDQLFRPHHIDQHRVERIDFPVDGQATTERSRRCLLLLVMN